MAGQAGIYVGIVLGAIVLLSIFVGILLQKHRMEVKELRAAEQAAQERMQQTVDLNLPPCYVDHELDPVCIFEHELPPDTVLPVQPILVHSPSENHIIPPDEDPLVASPPLLQRGNSSYPFPTTSNLSVATGEDSNSTVSAPAATSTMAASSGTDVTLAVELPEESSAVQASSPPSLPPPAAIASSSSSLSLVATGSSIMASPRIINQEMLNLARLPAPPSYDAPNRVVDWSPLGPPPHRRFHHHHSHSASDAQQFMPSPSVSAHRERDDYFGHARMRAHTISHPTSNLQYQQQQHQGEQDLPETPRYSSEFPSDVPHEQHLEEHQRARALHTLAASSSHVSLYSGDSVEPHAIPMSDRFFSQPYYPSSLASGDSVEQPQSQRQRQRQGRPRASTFGESSKLLVQRMQALWRKTSSASQSPMTSGQSSINSSSLNVASQQELGLVGLGLNQAGPEQEQRPGSNAQEERRGEDMAMVNPVDHMEVASPPSSTIVVSSDSFDSIQSTEQGRDVEGDVACAVTECQATDPHTEESTHIASIYTTVSMPVDVVSMPAAAS
ncbi:hypothetical protein BGZ58_009118 [Dissophora ornata]|nr:hypothetical protein BGZ58_009118 [Dissophora ornata]